MLFGVIFEGLVSPMDPVFLFFSDNPLVAIFRIFLASSLVYFSFKRHLSASTRNLLAIAGGLLIITGFTSLMITELQSTFLYTYFRYLDFLVMIEAGVIFSSIALSGKPRVRLERKTA